MSFQSTIRIVLVALIGSTAGAFEDTFSTWGTLEEAGSMAES